MKLLPLLLFFFMACNQRPVAQSFIVAEVKKDTIIKVVYVPVINNKSDSLIKIIKKLRQDLFIANYKVERVRYYMKICIRRPGQTKFLVSWIHRAIQ